MNLPLHRGVITLRAAGLGFGLGVAVALVFAGAWGALVAGSVVSMILGRLARRWQPPEDSVDAMLNALGAVMRWWLAGYVGGAIVGWFAPALLGPYGAAAALVAGSVLSMALTVWQLGKFGA